jgi:choline dehydrogenase-like flavoprotein
MKTEFDVIIIGSGPSGVSVAFPLVRAGLNVLMVDGGKKAHDSLTLPQEDYLSARLQALEQWKWIIGEDFYALKSLDAVSPKLRAPTHAYVFDEFLTQNHIIEQKFTTIGSLSTGGLSNAWGCGVARFSEKDLSFFPFPASDLDTSYADISKRIGISGQSDDDLSDYFGLDAFAQAPIPMDKLHTHLLTHYVKRRKKLNKMGMKIGRSRVAVLSRPLSDRGACQRTNHCLWGCHQQAMYSAQHDLVKLNQYKNFKFVSGFIAQDFIAHPTGWTLLGNPTSNHGECSFQANKIIFAAGTLSSTRLILKKLNYREPRPLLSCPTAAFLLWIPKLLGSARKSGFGLGQLSFTLELSNSLRAFGSTFATTGILLSEFVRHAPLGRPNSIDLFNRLLSSCVIGNLFLPGELTHAQVQLKENNTLNVTGHYASLVEALMSEAAGLLRKTYGHLGALLVPKSFKLGAPGADIHYSGTLPMKIHPQLGETSKWGEVVGLKDIYVVDGSCLPTLPEKSHTLTIMANADRIGHHLASKNLNLNRALHTFENTSC